MYFILKRKDLEFKVMYSEQHHELVSAYKWGISAFGYVVSRDPKTKKSISMHRLILGLNHNEKRMCDHINGNRLDNRIENLRICTALDNCRNKGIYKNKNLNNSIYKGVKKVKSGKFRAAICADYKQYHIGTFKTQEEAARAYDEAAKRLHGNFARTNF